MRERGWEGDRERWRERDDEQEGENMRERRRYGERDNPGSMNLFSTVMTEEPTCHDNKSPVWISSIFIEDRQLPSLDSQVCRCLTL